MQIDKAYLDLWAESLFEQSRLLLQVATGMCRINAPVDIIATLQEIRRTNSRTLNSLVSAGATNPLQSYLAEKSRPREWGKSDATGLDTMILGPIPAEMLTSPLNQAFLETLRTAQSVGRLVDAERGGWTEGWSDILGSFVITVEMEVTGREAQGSG